MRNTTTIYGLVELGDQKLRKIFFFSLSLEITGKYIFLQRVALMHRSERRMAERAITRSTVDSP